jgi:beta-N-acetylhexosaminidase
VQSLTADLQQLTVDSAQATADRPVPRAFVPLFIATTHLGNNLSGTQIAGGTTPLPSQMALGATWNPIYAQQVGQIAGAELEAMGVNMLLGPALDVAQHRRPNVRDLGVDTFGGEPYWVGKMGRAYKVSTKPARAASWDRKHFPGGLADTQPNQQIPLCRAHDGCKSLILALLRRHRQGTTALARADGLQCANIRYLGENIRSIHAPGVCG